MKRSLACCAVMLMVLSLFCGSAFAGWTKTGSGELAGYRVVYGSDSSFEGTVIQTKYYAPRQEFQFVITNWNKTDDINPRLNLAVPALKALEAEINAGQKLKDCGADNCYKQEW